MKRTPANLSFTNNRKKRNLWVYDAGLHTQYMSQHIGESDVDFVNRFLSEYFKGCRNRGGKKYKHFILEYRPEDDRFITWGRI